MLTMSAMDHVDHSKIIDALGGNVAVATMFGVSSQAISKWRKEGIPNARLMYLKLARPDVFTATSQEGDAAYTGPERRVTNELGRRSTNHKEVS